MKATPPRVDIETRMAVQASLGTKNLGMLL